MKLFNRDLKTTTWKMARAFEDRHGDILDKCTAMKEMDGEFFSRHFAALTKEAISGYEMSLAGFLVLSNMMDDPLYALYLREIQAVCIDLDIILRGPMRETRELDWNVPLEDMAETIKANLEPLMSGALSDRDRRRRDFAFSLIDQLSPNSEYQRYSAI